MKHTDVYMYVYMYVHMYVHTKMTPVSGWWGAGYSFPPFVLETFKVPSGNEDTWPR